MGQTIQYSVNDSVGVLCINRPEKHNSLGAAELEGVSSALDLIETDPEIRVLVVTGAGDKTFCAGASLDDLNSGVLKPDAFQSVMHRLASLSIPTLARVNGNVFGGGTELALSCDFRIGVKGSRLRVPAAAFGLCYPPAGISLFVEKLGVNVARRMLVASEAMDAGEAHRVGFYDYMVARDELDERVEELTLHIAGLAPLATKAMKELVDQAGRGSIDIARATELARQCEESDDLQEGFAAQREKRMPQFSGS
ncbi:enoyl-CoA hydratase/isomerase family protein [Congregibacter litoralis]|uniref:Enoyl-CoA hydratase/carnithine racemase n=1 Tax=Congregibacter litoralis KT71 TaxID=314285 RepID=A4A5Q1_9GAMM|nr:enoyl-CoA hydratase/isomerase family protein [Congregibacter litoralis]EAQ98348.1 Enoyl-CoA hydratase/carnithine racemase [Congregibacter litoralis KT71]